MNKLIPVLSALLLGACGFHLKGTQSYDRLPLAVWQVNGGALQQDLEAAIHRAGARSSKGADAQAEIRVLSEQVRKDVYTITRAAQLNEYQLTLQAEAQTFRNGEAWGAPMKVEIRRTMPYSDSLVLGKQEEEQIIVREMRADAAEQLVRRLGFLTQEAQ